MSRRLAVWLSVMRSSIGVVSVGRFFGYWDAVSYDTTGLSCSAHHSEGILMVGGRVSSIRSRENAAIFPSVLVELVK